MSISLGADRITLLLSVCVQPPPSHPQSIRPDIPVSALPYASQAHLRHICSDYICLFSAATMPSPISECSLFAFVATTGSDFHLFIYARHLSPRPSRDDLTMEVEWRITAWMAPSQKGVAIAPVTERASSKREKPHSGPQ